MIEAFSVYGESIFYIAFFFWMQGGSRGEKALEGNYPSFQCTFVGIL